MLDTSFSLLERLRTQPDADAWTRLVDLYTPLLRAWLRRYDVIAAADADDLVQDVLLTVSKEMPRFQPQDRPGAFRGWLRTILVNRLRNFWRARNHRPKAIGGSDFLIELERLADDSSHTSRLWDAEHDRQLMARLLELVEPRFAPETWAAFRCQAVEGRSAEEVARMLNMPLHSVYAAKSRVLKLMRTMAAGLLPD